MLSNPKIGHRVRLHYRAALRDICSHGRCGVIAARGTGKPRNRLVRLDGGELVIVPCGNVNKEQSNG